jgi:crotonobetainyl-CoA:carnitine CoA-transferase CaiB-like acyl-CoA transferase
MEWTAGGLEGIGVVDLTGDLVGLFCAHRLRSFGAGVASVHPAGGDQASAYGSGIAFVDARDLRLPGLVAEARLVVDRDDDLADAMAHHREAQAVRLVVTPFGRAGPYARYRATDLTAEAFAGALGSCGLADRAPLGVGGHLISTYVGAVAAAAGLAEVLLAEETGEGSVVEVTWVGALAASMDRRAIQLLVHSYTGWDAARDDGRPSPLLNGLHRCADGWVYLSLYGWQIRTVCELIGTDELDPFLARPGLALREPGSQVLRSAVDGWLAARTRAEAVAVAQARGWPVTPANGLAEALDDPWLREVGLVGETGAGAALPATGIAMSGAEEGLR